MTRYTFAILTACGLLSACAATNPVAVQTLTAAGDKNASAHVADVNALGQLACVAADGAWIQVVGANVVGATAAAVAKVCDAAQPGSMPGAVPDPAVARIVTVTDPVLQMLAASKMTAAK